jgi:hypothetical protein
VAQAQLVSCASGSSGFRQQGVHPQSAGTLERPTFNFPAGGSLTNVRRKSLSIYSISAENRIHSQMF